MEAFSDAVVAIAITLLVLVRKVASGSGVDLWGLFAGGSPRGPQQASCSPGCAAVAAPTPLCLAWEPAHLRRFREGGRNGDC